MDIGLKLDIGFTDNDACRRLYGDRDVLPYLSSLGVTALETAVGPETDPQAIKTHIDQCTAAGMTMSFHPYSEGTIFNAACFSPAADNPCRILHRRFLVAASLAAHMQGAPAIVNIHAAAGPTGADRRGLLDRSVAFFLWARDWCASQAPQVTVTTELQFRPHTEEPILRIADNWDELLEIVERCAIGACWDFGHSYKNAKRFDLPQYPPEALLEHVAHVHCHDACGRDHQPLVHDNVPWRDFIRLLVEHGFDGRIILEVPAWDFLQTGGIRSLADSLRVLGDWGRRCRTAV